MLADLSHTLASQGIDACVPTERPKNEALATLSVEISTESKASVEIEVRDQVTRKRVGREVDLTQIPADGRELAVAIEADELLRASWAELALDTARARAAKPKPEVVASVSQALALQRQSAVGLGSRFAAEHYAGGTTLLGVDAFGELWPTGRLSFELAGSVRASPKVTSRHGDIRALAAGGALSGAFDLVAGSRGALAAGLGVSASYLEFRAQAAPGAESSSYADLLLVARFGLGGRLSLGRSVALTAALGAGYALRGVEATDAAKVATGANGVELSAALGILTR